MRQNMRTRGSSSEKTVKDMRRATRTQYSAEEKIRINWVKPYNCCKYSALSIFPTFLN